MTKKYKIRYVRDNRTIITRVVLSHKSILNALDRNKNGFHLIITLDYEFTGEKTQRSLRAS